MQQTLRISAGAGPRTASSIGRRAQPRSITWCGQLRRRIPAPARRCLDGRREAPARIDMKKVLILGVNGFIGHHLSKRIVASTDWEIHGMDMQTERITDLLEQKRFHFFEGDITINKEWIEYHIKKCDAVLPLVAIATPAA